MASGDEMIVKTKQIPNLPEIEVSVHYAERNNEVRHFKSTRGDSPRSAIEGIRHDSSRQFGGKLFYGMFPLEPESLAQRRF